MSFLTWTVLGLISGFIASKIVNKSGKGVLMDIVLGIVGAVLGGWLFNTFGHMGVTGVNLYSILVAVVGAVIVLFIYHAVSRSSAHGGVREICMLRSTWRGMETNLRFG
jgi:uncharacterized membrane protein YeaQ/YmgE (transglycosylase-associated protein family)